MRHARIRRLARRQMVSLTRGQRRMRITHGFLRAITPTDSLLRPHQRNQAGEASMVSIVKHGNGFAHMLLQRIRAGRPV